MELTQPQKEMLTCLGSPKGSALLVLDDRVYDELAGLGLVHPTDRPTLTPEGERVSRELAETS